MHMDSKAGIGSLFPTIHGHDLARADIVLPAHARGHVTLVVLVSARKAQAQVDSWIAPFEQELCPARGYMYYEVPMISGAWGRMFSGYIDAGMRAGIPHEKHQHVVTYYGDYGEYASQLSMDDPSLCYPFLLDADGVVRWRSQGYATQEALSELLTLAKSLQSE